MVLGIGLISGGLDSLLAVKLLQGQGISVLGVSFKTPFFGPEQAVKAVPVLNIEFKILDITDQHMKVMRSPKHGFGANMNPCIDCHALMVKEAYAFAKEAGGDFVFTGEVLNERPKSQNRRSLEIVERESGCQGYLLRPLSAKLLSPTVPELDGRIDRERLLDIQGRSRKRQIELAGIYGVKEFPTPAGGCLLTDKGYSRRLKDLMAYDPMPSNDIKLLRVGRHYKLSTDFKLIVGRDEKENTYILDVLNGEGGAYLYAEDVPGPVCALRGDADEDLLLKSAEICSFYSDLKPLSPGAITLAARGERLRNIEVTVPAANRFRDMLL